MSSIQSLPKTVLKNPSSIKTKSLAQQLHAQIVKTNATTHLNLNHESLIVFNTLHPSSPPSLGAWKSIIRYYTSNGLFLQTLTAFVKMWDSGVYPDHNVFPSVIKSCTHLVDLRFGESVHGCSIRLGIDFDLFTGNALMNMYSKLETFGRIGGLGDVAGQVFDKMPKLGKMVGNDVHFEVTSDGNMPYFRRNLERDLPSCESFGSNSNELLGNELEKCVSGDDIMGCSKKMNYALPPSNKQTAGFDRLGMSYEVSRRNGEKEALRLDSVRKVFEMMPKRDLVSWNTLIAGNAQNGLYKEALYMVREMGKANLQPDPFTLSSVLPIFAEYVGVMKGKEIHGYAIRHGLDTNGFIGSSLIDMYANCTRVEDSCKVFNLLPQGDIVSWSSVIAGCVQNGAFDEGLKLFRKMLLAKIKPVNVTFSSIMPACAHLTTVHLGKQLHGCIIRGGFDDNVFIASSLVDMYARCGNIKTARWIFNNMEQIDIVSWTAMIMGCALHGHADEAISLFKQMEMGGVKPNSVAFVAVLAACSHAKLVEEGLQYFNSMIHDYGISPGLEHYASVADLLGRAGKLEEAYGFISRMHTKPEGSVWLTLLASCRVHKNTEVAEKVAEKIFTLDPNNVVAYVLLSNTYSAAGRWKEAEKLRTIVRDKGMRKKPACSWIEVNNKVHAFVAGDKSHPYYDKINEVMTFLLEVMEREGYVVDTNEVLHDVEEEQKRVIA
ncbi:putative pentatricopeptide repeat-containing protein At3g23330 [Rhododendron vialii]|uniref:putative pentatricopeptide repeat-containing protein At3g23330 n=1 Tax=Rhododendron vialii TaxID=182163 RepID=UPI00265D7591|nr:putative pentatricopeptide repeat-containing protein At3g23330 [Rhododendron vialii]XP_058209378.1 putative pentatricopeptide repeat-containing protein At3g23330 [Rhododendron vialii]